MSKNLKRGTPFRTGMAVMVIVSLLVAGWRLVIIARQPAHLMDIAREIGSIPQTEFGVFPNPDGSRLIYFQDTETGVGAYLCDTGTGKSRLMFEQKEKGYGESRIWGWSPENALLAFTIHRDRSPADPPMAICIYDGLSGQNLTNIPAPSFQWDSQFIWLSKRSFVYSTAEHRSWLMYALNSDGVWQEVKVVKRFFNGNLPNLRAISPHTIGWLEKGNILTFDFDTGAQEKLWKSTTNNLEGFNYFRDTGNLVLNCRDKNGQLSVEFRPPRLSEKEGTIIGVKRIKDRDFYADLDRSKGIFSFKIKTRSNPKPTSFVWDGLLRNHVLVGDNLYFTGNPPDDTPGLWQYNTVTKEVKCLVPGQKDKLKYAKVAAPVTLKGTNAAGKEMIYHIWEPVGIRPGKKYPLLLGVSLHDWNFFPEVAANSGFYYATPNLVDWFKQIGQWPKDMTGLYEILSKHPNIDTNRVYFVAYSGQVGYLNQVLAANPHLCQGLVLFHPSGIPDLPLINPVRVMVFGGYDDPDSPAKELIRQQDEAFKLGIPVHLFIQDGVQHFIKSIGSEREQSVQLARFLIENKGQP